MKSFGNRNDTIVNDSPELTKLARLLQEQHGVAVNSLTYAGSTPEAICRAAIFQGANLIVLHASSKQSISSKLRGSAAYRVSIQSVIPVLAVPGEIVDPTFDSVLFPYIDKPRSRAHIPRALSLVSSLSASAHLLAYSSSRRNPTNIDLLRAGDALSREVVSQGIPVSLRLQSGSSYAFEVQWYSSLHRISLIVMTTDDGKDRLNRTQMKTLKALLGSSDTPVLSYPALNYVYP